MGYLPQSGNRLTLYFKNYPLEQECNPNVKRTIHPGACALALGGICAAEQGKFWAYHDRVFQAPPPNPGLGDVERLGQQAGLDAAALKACLSTPRAKQRLSREIAEAVAIGVDATPTIFINGKKLPRINDFSHVVDQEAARQGVPPMAPAAK
jgi:protein-disulfide isomerase